VVTPETEPDIPVIAPVFAFNVEPDGSVPLDNLYLIVESLDADRTVTLEDNSTVSYDVPIDPDAVDHDGVPE
jgi:hypothetical protein